MTRSQVRYLLGTPMVADSFNKERWDYIYYLKKGRTRHVDSRRVTVYFDGEKVARLDKPTAPRRRRRTPPRRKSRTAGLTRRWRAAEFTGSAALALGALLGAAREFRIRRQRPIDLDSIARLERLIGTRELAEDADRRAGQIDAG
jgi:hypothetical protein